jgi:hypothetical protein
METTVLFTKVAPSQAELRLAQAELPASAVSWMERRLGVDDEWVVIDEDDADWELLTEDGEAMCYRLNWLFLENKPLEKLKKITTGGHLCCSSKFETDVDCFFKKNSKRFKLQWKTPLPHDSSKMYLHWST